MQSEEHQNTGQPILALYLLLFPWSNTLDNLSYS
ncbi:hypothetical protein UAB78_002 [Escherichia phage UAB_Phi78]|uniref:Uncharacterized protein n=1 Tax=Escherichia phage UAB_Phi78 TaxID=979726 RepID=A0A8F5PMY2_9CAUD|nr:hypothetical protein I132_gp02 [Escherichia phage UAB_Phi78]QXM18125.1 hypothetical protein UAB78_002 [Escherichia phage UAB_Phi78]